METTIPCGNKGEKSSVKQGRFTAKKNEKSHKNNNAVLKHADKRIVKERSHYLKSNEFRSGNEDQQIPNQNEIDVSETVYPTDYDCLGDGIEVDVDPADDLVFPSDEEDENRPMTTSSEDEETEETEAEFLQNKSFLAESEVVLRQPQSPRTVGVQREPSTSGGRKENPILQANPELIQLKDAYFANRFGSENANSNKNTFKKPQDNISKQATEGKSPKGRPFVNDNIRNVKSPSDTTLYKPALCRRINRDFNNPMALRAVDGKRIEMQGDRNEDLIKKISDFVDSVRIDQKRRESGDLPEHQERQLPQPIVMVPGQEEARRCMDRSILQAEKLKWRSLHPKVCYLVTLKLNCSNKILVMATCF